MTMIREGDGKTIDAGRNLFFIREISQRLALLAFIVEAVKIRAGPFCYRGQPLRIERLQALQGVFA